MKKLITFALVLMMAIVAVAPVSAVEMVNTEFETCFDNLPDEYADAEVIALSSQWVEGASNARNSASTGFNYCYLKEDGNGDFVIKFTAEEDGIYYFAVACMGWTKSVLRSTDVMIDNGERCYMGYDYVEADQFKNHYFYGISAELTAGEHTVTFSLAEDFDDSNVKSLYMTDLYYYSEPLPEEAPAEEAPAEEAPTTAPATFDVVTLAAVAMAASTLGVVVSKKRK